MPRKLFKLAVLYACVGIAYTTWVVARHLPKRKRRRAH